MKNFICFCEICILRNEIGIIMSAQNFIDFEPAAIKIVRDREVYNILFDSVYEPIIIILREGPMTIEEITIRYNQYVEIQGQTKNLDSDAIEKSKKSEMTIYRYVKDLEKENVNLVTQAGRRIEKGKTTAKALYSRTAKLFYPSLKSADYWGDETADKFVEVQASLLQLYLKNTKISKPLLKELLKNLDNDRSEVGAKVFEENNEVVSEIIKDLPFKQVDKHLSQLNLLIMLFESEKYLEEFKKCCETE